MSTNTVCLRKVFRKLGVTSRRQLARRLSSPTETTLSAARLNANFFAAAGD
jgi:hypothetical protein